MNQPPCRWGILGTANIARKNWQAIHHAGNATLVAVASRDIAKSAQFISECQEKVPFEKPPEALGGYESLVSHPGVDAVYIPLPTGIRKEWIIRAAEAGKHVLAEKPAGCSVSDVAEIIDACARNRVQFMDGVMFMHSRRLARLRQILDDGRSVGHLRRISLQFSFAGGAAFMQRDIRTDGRLEPFGCLGDLGWYCIRLALWAMRYEMPVRVTGRIDSASGRTDPPVPLEFSGELIFPGGISAAFHSSFVAENAQWAILSGDKGYVHLPDFVLPFFGPHTKIGITRSEFMLDGCQFDMHAGNTEEAVDEPPGNATGSQEASLFRTFSALVLSGRTDAHWPDITLKTQKVMDGCMRSAQQNSAAVAVL